MQRFVSGNTSKHYQVLVSLRLWDVLVQNILKLSEITNEITELKSAKHTTELRNKLDDGRGSLSSSSHFHGL